MDATPSFGVSMIPEVPSNPQLTFNTSTQNRMMQLMEQSVLRQLTAYYLDIFENEKKKKKEMHKISFEILKQIFKFSVVLSDFGHL